MLSLYDPRARFGRREFLRVGGLALGGLSLPGLLGARAAAAQAGKLTRDKSVVLLFLHGGPSQFETFDPKMSAPSDIHSVTGEMATRIPGVTFGSTFPKLASMADKLTIVRSFTTGDARHDIKPVVCRDTLGANMGSIYSRIAGTNHPPHRHADATAALYPQAVDADTMPAIKNFGDFESTGTLGKSTAPFVPGGKGEMQQAMRLGIPLDRLGDRRKLLGEFDQARWTLEAGGALEGLDGMREQAFRVILGGMADAFDLSKEDPNTVARYDTAPLAAAGGDRRQVE